MVGVRCEREVKGSPCRLAARHPGACRHQCRRRTRQSPCGMTSGHPGKCMPVPEPSPSAQALLERGGPWVDAPLSQEEVKGVIERRETHSRVSVRLGPGQAPVPALLRDVIGRGFGFPTGG